MYLQMNLHICTHKYAEAFDNILDSLKILRVKDTRLLLLSAWF